MQNDWELRLVNPNFKKEANLLLNWCSHNLLPLLPPDLLVVSVGIGVTSSILPILRPLRARALIADWAPGPMFLDSWPPLPLSLMCTALIPTSLRALQTSTAASIAA